MLLHNPITGKLTPVVSGIQKHVYSTSKIYQCHIHAVNISGQTINNNPLVVYPQIDVYWTI